MVMIASASNVADLVIVDITFRAGLFCAHPTAMDGTFGEVGFITPVAAIKA
jgi:hypothetical protein